MAPIESMNLPSALLLAVDKDGFMKTKSQSPQDQTMQILGMAEAAFNQHMMALVMQGNPVREMAQNHDIKFLGEHNPEFKNPLLTALLIQIADRFELLIREGKTTTQSLKTMRIDGLLDRYMELTEPGVEVH